MLSLNMKKKESISSVSDVPKIVLFEEAGKENTGKRKKTKKQQNVSFFYPSMSIEITGFFNPPVPSHDNVFVC